MLLRALTRYRVLGAGCDCRARNKVMKSVLLKERNLLDKKIQKSIELQSLVLFFSF